MSKQIYVAKDVQEFLTLLQEITDKIEKSDKEKNILLLRGNSEPYKSIIPSVYYGYDDAKEENFFFKETLSRFPEEMLKWHNTVEKLILMQHYEIPTRLLDISKNPLVALYFACQDSKHEGRVLIFKVPESKIKYCDSDVVSILANVARLPSDFKYPVSNCFGEIVRIRDRKNKVSNVKAYSDYILKKMDSSLCTQCSLNHVCSIESIITREKIESACEMNRASKLYWEIIGNLMIDRITTFFNHDCYQLINEIHEEKPYFKDQIWPTDINQVVCLRPRMNNQRIIRQDGYFFLFGIKENNKECAEFKKSFHPPEQIKIPKDYKEKILKQLSVLNINDQFIFPEISMFGHSLKKVRDEKKD